VVAKIVASAGPEPEPATKGPGWSAGTLRVLAALPPVQEAFVRAYVTGLSAAEALRLATGCRTPLDRQAAYRLKALPTVAAAVFRCLGDPAYAVWMRLRIEAARAAVAHRAPVRVARMAGRMGSRVSMSACRGRATDERGR
jgi:hypothetical protein